MLVFAIESVFCGLSLGGVSPGHAVHWHSLATLASTFLPAFWLGFSITYSRGNYREFLRRWRPMLAASLLAPMLLCLGVVAGVIEIGSEMEAREGLWLSPRQISTVIQVTLLLANILILANLERTFRLSVGVMRWRIKFLLLGLAIIFGTRIYAESQALLFSAHTPVLAEMETGALLIGCLLIGAAYWRSGLAEIDVYPSHAVLGSTLTVLLAGTYLLVVGVLAQIVSRVGGAETFQAQVFIALLAVAGLGVLMLSDRLRARLRRFVSRHFGRPQYDFRAIWMLLTQRTSTARGEPELCTAAATLISETMQALSVTLWLFDESGERIFPCASTIHSLRDPATGEGERREVRAIHAGLRERRGAFDLDAEKERWAEDLRRINTGLFPHGGHRIAVALTAGERCLGVAILGDRVHGLSFTLEEMDLLRCIADQVAAGLLNFRFRDELIQARELEAFQSMSAFFVHDLKNAASTLTLMLQNLPLHFGDPEFRKDALRGIGSTAGHINHMISRLTALRHKLEISPSEADLNQIISESLAGASTGDATTQWVTRLEPLPPITADREQLHAVITNLFFNARDAVGMNGRVEVTTSRENGRVILQVSDNGCGMSPEFLRNSLFRPFRTTKQKGLGIGLFQSKQIIHAHGGAMHVDSEVGKGTTFRISLPVAGVPCKTT
ncbi:hypothetical protein AYO49_01125 [Verrucomicrobiaceae bacterium SCGC AG-212-N21]|nr:hypothetical protein AYO49_01125 [Verrucomicrobiaceae bacterium SCGC AG-212-N21]